METTPGGWTILDEPTKTLTREYNFAKGSRARTFVTQYADNELVIASPPSRIERSHIEELERFGHVTAIVAPNGFHYLGLPVFKEAFPAAVMYAPELAAKRIAKKLPDLGELHPLSTLQGRLEPNLKIFDVPGFKIGEVWITVATEQGPIWYVSDSCFSLEQMPKAFLPKVLLKWTKSAPGFKLNRLGNKMFLKDPESYKGWFSERLAEEHPRMVVTAHGSVVTGLDIGERMTRMVQDM